MLGLVPRGAILHRLEELVGERFHDERDDRAAGRFLSVSTGGHAKCGCEAESERSS